MKVSTETAEAVARMTPRQKAALAALPTVEDWRTLRDLTGIEDDDELRQWAADPIRLASLIREDAPRAMVRVRDARGRPRDMPLSEIMAAVEAARAAGAVNVNREAAARLGVSVSTIARAKRAAREMSQSTA